MESLDAYRGIICKIEMIQRTDNLRTAREQGRLHGVQEVGGSNPLAPTDSHLRLHVSNHEQLDGGINPNRR